jgi:hypothetical protein
MACSQSSPFPSPTQDPSPTPPPSATASRHTPIVQVGLDDVLHPWFREQQISQAQRVLASASSAACARAARTGLPPSARPAAWACALGLPPQPPQPQPEAAGVARPAAGCYLASRRDEDVLRVLCEGVERQQLLVDALTCGDTAAVAASEHYFLFADAIRRAGCTQGYGLEPAPHDCRPSGGLGRWARRVGARRRLTRASACTGMCACTVMLHAGPSSWRSAATPASAATPGGRRCRGRL